MDTNWVEYLLPIIFFVLYGVSKIFGKGEKQDLDAPTAPPIDIGEQQRRIQEEIRRRIAERREEAKLAEATQTLKPQEQRMERPVAPPRSPFREPEAEEEPQVVAPQHRPDPVALDMQQQLAAQMERLRDANRESESLRRSIKGSVQKTEYSIKKRGIQSKLRNEVTSMLKDAQSAKKAFLYSEIFGAPIGHRRKSTFTPLINQ